MKVELIESAGGDLSIVNSARVSFDKESEYVDGTLDERDAKLVNYLAKHQHMTPFRHNFIQLRCSVPLFLARQLMKHQAGLTWNEVSRRYVDDIPEFHYPTEWRSRPDKSIKQGSGGVHEKSEAFKVSYEDIVNKAKELYETMVNEGVAPEMARMVLPQNMYTEWYWSGTLMAFARICNLRCAPDTQAETRIIANKIKEQTEKLFPISWKYLTEIN